jgi:transposase InsO family protein
MRNPVGLVGAKAIRRELKQTYTLRRLPSTATIQRIVRRAKLTPNGSEAVEVFFPQPRATPCFVLHALDWTARYLEGGAKVFAFHTLDLATRATVQTISTDKSHPTAWSHVLKTWEILGIPDGLQVDNDAVFCGGCKTPRLLGQFVRLCLYVGVEPIFLPVREPERNGDVERFHELWDQAFWKRRRFRSVSQVIRFSPEFEAWYAHSYEPPTLNGQTPAQAHRKTDRRRLTAQEILRLPEDLPITEGRIHFIRCVNPEGQISLLNETWHVSKWLVNQYVWATIVTHQRVLKIYHRRSAESKLRLVKTYSYRLNDTVVPLQPAFKHSYRRRKVSTMS